VGKGHAFKGQASQHQLAQHAAIEEHAAKVAASAARDHSVPPHVWPQHDRAEGCRKDFFHDEFPTAPAERRGAARYAVLICRLLRKMHPKLRRKVISGRLAQWQRLALEACMVSQKQCPSKIHPRRRDTEKTSKQCKYGGVFKSECNGAVYGYYAKAGLCNLTFTAQIHRDLSGAVHDHVALSKLLEQIQTQCSPADFPAVVKSAVEAASGDNGFLSPCFFRNFSVSFPTGRWIGRTLSVHCQHLEGALHAWKLLDAFKDFSGPADVALQSNLEKTFQVQLISLFKVIWRGQNSSGAKCIAF